MNKNTAYILIFHLSLLFFTGCCKKEKSLQDASNAYLKGDYKEASEIFIPKAKKGDAEAQVNIAFMYYCGLHVKQDFTEAANWYMKAAERNNANAQFGLATLYENGEGVEQDLEEAYFWYSLAEQQGDEDAKNSRIKLEERLPESDVSFLKERIKNWEPLIIKTGK